MSESRLFEQSEASPASGFYAETAAVAAALTWVRRNGRRLFALRTESLQGDPFGRDRAGA